MSESYRQGLEEIAGTDPESGLLFVEELKRVSPDFAEYFVEFAFGKIHARKVLEPQVKELIAIATLIALGDGKSHLRLRILGAIRVGRTKEQIIEVIIQGIVHVGFTRAVVAMSLVREVFANPIASSSEPHTQPSSPGQSEKQRRKSKVRTGEEP